MNNNIQAFFLLERHVLLTFGPGYVSSACQLLLLYYQPDYLLPTVILLSARLIITYFDGRRESMPDILLELTQSSYNSSYNSSYDTINKACPTNFPTNIFLLIPPHFVTHN